jgi:cysteine desulfurase/selenocysteine lyase
LRSATWNDLPYKFEAGTPAIAETVGLGAAVDYLNALGMDFVQRHEQELVSYALERLRGIEGLALYGPEAAKRGGVVSFTLGDIHPHDLAQVLDGEGVCVRAGNHCAQPLIETLGLPATARSSFYIYNTPDEVDALVLALEKAKAIFAL